VEQHTLIFDCVAVFNKLLYGELINQQHITMNMNFIRQQTIQWQAVSKGHSQSRLAT